MVGIHRTAARLLGLAPSKAPRVCRFAPIVLLAGLIAFSGGAKAADEISYCFNDWPPYAHMDGATARGISVEILAEATRRSGRDARFVELPWNRCLESVRSGEIDAVIDAAHREEYIQGPASFSAYSNHFWVREDDPAQVYDDTMLIGRTLGLVEGYVYPETLIAEANRAGVTIDYAVDDGNNMEKLARGRVEVIVADLFSSLHTVREKGLAVRQLLPAHSADLLYPSFGPERGDKQRRINEALEEMLRDGFVDNLYRRYFGIGFREAMPQQE